MAVSENILDKYSATWVSHSSIADYLHCPRAYFLKNVYKDPKTNHKLMIVSPALSLGQAVHEVLEALSRLPVAKRFELSLLARYDTAWQKVRGKRGGFSSNDQEEKYHNRGAQMIERVINNPGVIGQKAVKIKAELPYYYLSKEENIIFCGKIDWLAYDEDLVGVKIVDFNLLFEKSLASIGGEMNRTPYSLVFVDAVITLCYNQS